MFAQQRWIALFIVAVAAVVGVSRFGGTNHPAPAGVSTAAHSGAEIVWSHGRDGAQANAEEHWEKHGAEFPEFRNAHEYAAGALRFVSHPPPGALTKSRDNGDTLFYDPNTNTFAVKDRRGEPRTFFRPDSGRAYWDRQ